jgi:antitoxin component YwqK of YwqJK toxin-antitoxin module
MLKNWFLFLFISFIPLSLFCQDTVFNSFDKNGKKTGFWKTYYENGKLRYSGYFENDKPVGEIRKYYPGGLPQSFMVFERTSSVVYAKLFNVNGKLMAEGKYIGESKDSIWNYYSSLEGHLALRETFSMGKKKGVSSKYYSNGNISEIQEWENDIQHGKWEQYYENSDTRLKCSYLDGERSGDFQSFYPGGKVSIKGKYKNGLMHGDWIYYKENGDKDISVEYLDGKMLPNEEYERRAGEFSKKIEEIAGDFPEPADMKLP